MIELMVIVAIMGVLAASALPKFLDVRSGAAQAANDNIADTAAAAMTSNASGCLLSKNAPGNNCQAINVCSQVGTILQGGLGAAFTAAANVTGADIGKVNAGRADCKISSMGGGVMYTSVFTGVSAGN